jgi:hypothetical protein
MTNDSSVSRETAEKIARENILIYRVFNAIWRNNYETSEWWAMEWSRHSGWGPSFMQEETDIGLGGSDVKVTESNYLSFESFVSMGKFCIDNFKLYVITETGDLLTHGPLPIITDQKVQIMARSHLITKACIILAGIYLLD